jgi:predicted NBD/HSP70 family sugar kinase
MGQLSLGIDIGGTFIKYALVDDDFNIVRRWRVPSIHFETKDGFYDYLCSNCGDVNIVSTIGISAAGLIDKMSNVKSYAAPNLIIMYGSNVNNEISKRTGKKAATINDAKAAGLCELKVGNAQNAKSSAFMIIGTGTGGCICNEEDVIYGKDGFAAEFHHLPFIDLRDNSIKRQGDYASITALIQIYNSKVNDGEAVQYGKDIIEKYLMKNEIAIAATEEWINNIVVELLTIAVFYNPEVICVGGGISEENWFIELVKERFKKLCCDYFQGSMPVTTEIRPCKYNNDANILGAILNSLNEYKQ